MPVPGTFGSNGLVLPTRAELVTFFETAFQNIYGPYINLDPETPDGQMINIFIQAILDLQDLLQQINSTFDPDNAIGIILDQRCAINGIQRAAGTFSTVNIDLVLNQSVNLFGLDQTTNPVYTVADPAGNQWQLQVTQSGAGPGSVSYVFQAALPGALTAEPNTITIPVSIILGVTSINNPNAQLTTGINEESDAALKVRRQRSVSLPARGYFASLLAALENIEGVSFANIIENVTDAVDVYGVPGHSIWVVVAGSSSPADIANAIYVNRTAGCGLFSLLGSSSQSFDVTQADGSIFEVVWDNVELEDLFIKFTATSLNGINPPNILGITEGLPDIFVPGVFEEVNINGLATDVQSIDPNTLVTNAGFSLAAGGTYTVVLTPSLPNKQFSVASDRILIYPMILSPENSQVVALGSQQFITYGGYGPYTYSIDVNNSGGSIGSATGLYIAGSTPSVTDTILTTDFFGSTGTAFVAVV